MSQMSKVLSQWREKISNSKKPYKEVLAEVSKKCISGGPQIWKSLNGGTLARKAYMYMSMADPGVTLVLDWNSLYTVICWQCTTSQVARVAFLPCGLPSKRLYIAFSWVWKSTHWVSYTAVLSNSQHFIWATTLLWVCVQSRRQALSLPISSTELQLNPGRYKQYALFILCPPATYCTNLLSSKQL